jgi:hypothetical protein
LNLIVPFEPSDQFQWYMPYGNLTDGNGKNLNNVQKVYSDGGVASDWTFAYVNKAGSFTVSNYRFTFPEEGWYAVNAKREAVRLNPPNYTLPDGCYWVVVDRPTSEVIWWKK